MKKIKGLILTLAFLFLMPLAVFASDNEKINVYIFRGEGCQYCARALAFFEGLDDEYQSYFNLVEREVWYDTDNATLMQTVADYFGDTVNGVPYIIIGDKTFNGYASDYDDEIKEAIKTAYENVDGTYEDIVGPILDGAEVTKKSNDNSAITVIVILVTIAGIGFLVYMARDDEEEKNTKKVSNEPKKNVSVKEKKEEVPTPKKSTAKKSVSTKKTTSTKKSTTTKQSGSKTTTTKKKTTSKK
jgi:glutaredoxin